MNEIFPTRQIVRERYDGPQPPTPDDGSRAENDAAALAKADEKRARKAKKRMGSNVQIKAGGVNRPE